MADETDNTLTTELTAEIVSAYVSNNVVQIDGLPDLIRSVRAALDDGAASPVSEKPEERPKPAVSIRKSLQNDQLTCLEDGKTFKSLKRHLKTSHGMTPEQYRERWGLPADYPMVAPAYAEARSKLATEIGLGQKRKK